MAEGEFDFDAWLQETDQEPESSGDPEFDAWLSNIQVADESPLPVNRKRTAGGSGLVPEFEYELPEDNWMIRAAEAGVVYDNPAPAGHFYSSFAFDEAERAKEYRNAPTEYYGVNVPVRMGDSSGRLEWFNPENSRWTLVDPPVPGMNDITDVGGHGLTAVLEGIGTAGLVYATGGVGGMSAGNLGLFVGGEGLVTILAETARLKIGQSFGLNEDIDDGDAAAHFAMLGMMSGALGLTGEAGQRAAVALWKWTGLRITSRDMVKRFNLDLSRAADVEDIINQRIATGEFRLRLGQASGREELLAIERLVGRNFGAAEFAEQNQAQDAALKSFWQMVTDPFTTRTLAQEGSRGIGRRVQDVAGTVRKRELEAADNLVAVKRAEMQTMTDGLQDSSDVLVGEPLRGFVESETTLMRQWADEVVSEFSEIAGNVKVAPTRTAELANALDEKAQNALFDFQKREIRSIVGDRTETVVVDGEATQVVRRIFDPEARLSIDETWDAIKALKRMERAAPGSLGEPANKAQLKQIIGALEDDMRKALVDADPTLDHIYVTFRNKYRTETNRLRRGLIGELMKEADDGTYAIADPQVFDQIFKHVRGNDDAAKQLYSAIHKDPASMDRVRGAILENWKTNRRLWNAKGELNIREHEKWLKDYKDTVELFLNESEQKALRSGRGFAEAIDSRIQMRKEAFEKINRMVETDIYNFNKPERVIRDMLVPGESEFAKDVLRIVRQSGDEELLGLVQSAVQREIMDMVQLPRGAEGYVLNRTALRKILKGTQDDASKGIAGNLRVIMGDQYVDDLMVLEEALSMTMREAASTANASGTAAASSKALLDMTRAYVGLFTTEGRIVTALGRMRGRGANRALMNAIANPEDLRTLIKIKDLPVTDGRVTRFLTTMGANAMLLPENDLILGPIERNEDE